MDILMKRGGKGNAIWYIALAILIFACVRTILIINFDGFVRYCDSDMYADTLVAKLMWEQKTLFPDNWVFGNQFYVIATPVLCALFYGITGNLNFSMGMASSLMGILVVNIFIWMLSPFVKRKINLWIAVTALLCCVRSGNLQYNFLGQLFFIMCSYYSCYLIVAFFVWGVYARFVFKKGSFIRRRYLFCLFACSFFSFALGVQSIRQTAVMVLPLCMVEGMRLIKIWICKKREGQCLFEKYAFYLVCAVTTANLLGLAANHMLNARQYVFVGGTSFIHQKEVLMEKIQKLCSSLKTVMGLVPQDHAVLTIINVLIAAVLVAVLIKVCRRRDQRDGLGLLLALSLISLFIAMGAGVLLDMDFRPVYLFMWYPLSCLAIVSFLESCHEKDYKIYVFVFIVFAWIGGYFLSYVPMRSSIEWAEAEYRERLEIAEWMTENGYDVLYGPWNMAQWIAVASNGAIECGCWEFNTSEGLCEITPWLMKTDLYTEECNERALYFVHNDTAETFVNMAAAEGAEVVLVWRLETSQHQIYSSSRQLMHPRS